MVATGAILTFRPENFVTEAVNVSGLISDSPFTVEWLLKSLYAHDKQFIEHAKKSVIEHISAYDISEGQGYVSKVYKTSIKFQHSDEPYQVILKVPGCEAFNEDSACDGEELMSEEFVKKAHNLECEFYKNFAAHIDIPLVKMYNVTKIGENGQRGALLMESMVGKAETRPYHQGASVEMVYNVAKHMATFYAYFLSLPKDKWLGEYKENIAVGMTKEQFYPFYARICDMKPEVFEKPFEIFKEYVCSKSFFNYFGATCYKDLGLPVVLTHGDLWTNNIMWKKNPDGSVSNEVAAILDFQTFHEGCITSDLARYMCLSMDGDVRRKHEFEILRFMYDRIVKLLEEKDEIVDFTLNRSMKQGYKTNFVAQGVLSMLIVSFIYGGESKERSWTAEERPIKMAEREKLLIRTQLAVEDAVQYFKDVSKDRF
ncbi:hypothetical protein L596_023375 [Steinernema carpocapsae]|uniref:CHK kinase-like domain-containing protein n=1 Tax=Steinernema carpocapsae TaxID=34508 RepID=A0A4U5MDG5_STECR|nr:hypothetical protein L596_023375 [Steinernema carpocapsae]